MTDKIDDGGPAFPFGQVSEVTGQPINGYHNDGMSLRDYLAAKALQGLLAGLYRDNGRYNLGELTDEAYRIADAMLQARKESNDE